MDRIFDNLFAVKEAHLWKSPRGAPLTTAVKMDEDSVVRSGEEQIMYLTPNQDQARRSFDKGVLAGPAGTGKTIILGSKAAEVLERNDGRKVLYLASHPHDIRMLMYFQGDFICLDLYWWKLNMNAST